MKRNPGTLFIVSAPSGAGKTTLINKAIEHLSGSHCLERVITCTTRAQGMGEVAGVDYHYLQVAEFEQGIAAGFFLEWSTAYGTYYGTPHSITEKLAQGVSLLLILDRPGAQKLSALMPEAVLIWIYTKNIEVLRTRMGVRMRDDQAEIERRLLLAQSEIEEEQQNRLYKYHIFNDIFEQSLEDLKKVLRNFLDEQICDQSIKRTSRSINTDI